jgi:MHS family proline/betaine transporter-like MFS transporter
MTLATVAFGLLPTYAAVGLLAPVLLLLCRVLQGMSVSAELPGAMLLVLEHTPINRRGLAVSINTAGAGLATVAAATVSLVLARLLSPDQLAAWGWRAFLIAAPIGIVGFYVRTRLLDSPAFLALGQTARQGRPPLARAVRTAKRGMLVLTVWFAAHSIGGYTLSVLMPSYLIRNAGLPPAEAYAATLVAVLIAVPFTLLGGFLVDQFPLRRMAIAVMAGTAVTAVPGFLIIAAHRTFGGAVIGQVVLAILLGAVYIVGALLAMTLFPTGIRFTALALPLNVGTALFGGTAPYVSTWLAATTHSPLAPGFYLLAAAAIGTLAAIVGLRHRDVPTPHNVSRG